MRHPLLDRSATCLQAGLVHAVLLTLSAPAKLPWMLREWLMSSHSEPREGEWGGAESRLRYSRKGLQSISPSPHPRGRRTVGF